MPSPTPPAVRLHRLYWIVATGKSVAVALDEVDDGQAHLEALRELSRWDNAPEQKGLVCIAGEKDPAEAT
jgi:hypothetical protein